MVQNLGQHGPAFRLIAVILTGGSFGTLEVPCFSWIEAARSNTNPIKRCFFCIAPTVPDDTPEGLLELRQAELSELRGELDESGEMRKSPDRIYEWDVYNDLNKESDERYGNKVLVPWMIIMHLK